MSISEARRAVGASATDIVDGLAHGAFLGFILYPMWGYLDLIEAKKFIAAEDPSFNPAESPWWIALKRSESFDPAMTCIGIRCAVMFLMVVYIFVAFKYRSLEPSSDAERSWRPWVIRAGALSHLVLGLGIVALIWTLRGFEGNYFSGLIMVFIVISILTPWEPLYTGLQISALTLAFAAAAYVHYDYGTSLKYQAASNMMFIAGAGVLCFYGAYKYASLRDRLMERATDDGSRGHSSLFDSPNAPRRLKAGSVVLTLAAIVVPSLALFLVYQVTSN